MKANPWKSVLGPSGPSSATRVSEPQCEVLFDLFEGELGRVQLGRLLTGKDAGRLVTLRKLSGPPSTELSAAVALARSIADPKLIKALGVLHLGESFHLANEYIAGVSLFELEHALQSRAGTLSVPVAVRLVVDMLHAALAAEQSLSAAAHSSKGRYLHPESVWIADFGETFLSDVLVSRALLPSAQLAERDVLRAGFHLLGLLSGSTEVSALDDTRIPDLLRHVIARATGFEGSAHYASVAELADALLESEADLVATNEEVSQEIRRVMGSVLDIRRQKLAMIEREALQERSEEDETKFFRAVAAPQLETARPPRPSTQPPRLSVASSGTGRVSTSAELVDEPTTLFRSSMSFVPVLASAPLPVRRSDAEPRVNPVPTLDSVVPQFRTRLITPRRFTGALVLLLAVIAFVSTSGGPRADYYAVRQAAHLGWLWLLEHGAALLR